MLKVEEFYIPIIRSYVFEYLLFAEKTRKIMHVHTECSEYQAVIGKFGKVILDDALHGKMVYPVCKKDRRK